MMLRWIVSNWVQQTAKQRLYDVISETGLESKSPPDDQSDPAVEFPPCEVAFIFALGVEAGGLVDKLNDRITSRCPTFLEHGGFLQGRRVIIAQSGVGCQLAVRATDDLIALHQPTWVVASGFAGALVPDLRRGDILMANEVMDTDGHHLAVGLNVDHKSVEASPALHVGRLLTVDHLIRVPTDRHRLADQYGAVACDMETMAVAEACRRANVPCISVRIISDAVDDELPKGLETMLNQKSFAGKLGAAAGAIVNRPSSVKDMWRLQEDALKATDRLGRFLVGVVEQLCLDQR